MQRAMAAYEAGRAAEAKELCSLVLAADPNHLDAINILGAIALQRGDLAAARDLFERAVRAAPGAPDPHNNLGVALQQSNRWDEALAAFDRAIALAPAFADAWFNRGVVLTELQRWDDALASYRRAIGFQPRSPRYFNNLGNVLQRLHRWADALAAYESALALRPDYVEALVNCGVVLRQLRRWDEALRRYDAALAIRPGHAEALNNRAVALRETNRWEESVESCRQALATRPGYPEALNNLGFALHELGRFDEALRSYEQAIEARPDFAEANWNMALLHLARGEYLKGWKLFEWRWKTEDIAPSMRTFPRPLWLGREPLEGKTILVHSEQGLGDTIQFARFLGPLRRRAARVILESPRALVTLMASSFPEVDVVASNADTPDFDFHCPLASLPYAFGTTLETIPGGAAYLAPSDEARRRWSEKLGSRTRARVGLAWAGNPALRNDHNRSIPFARLAPLLDLDIEFHSLQKDIRDSDRAAVERDGRMKTWGAELADFSDTAALVLGLDLVISVDTASAHLSGALGRPTWIALPYRADYRYLLDRSDSPWYPSARLFRQQRPGDWDGVVSDIRKTLAAQS